MKKLLAGLCALGMVMCFSSDGLARSKDSTPLAKKPECVQKAHDAIRAQLDNPESAEFKCDVSSSDENIMGLVRSKGADGVETAFKQFNVIFDRNGRVTSSSVYMPDVEPVMVNAICRASESGRME